MTAFTIYDKATLEVIAVVQAPSVDDVASYLDDNKGFVEGSFSWSDFYIDAGVPIEYSADEKQAKLNRPAWARYWSNITKEWVDHRKLADIKAAAASVVDDLAGRARLRYITSVPGQAETYQKKEQQAREWSAASFFGEPPSFIAAEAVALGQDPTELAREVIGLADYWSNIKGPEIEASRRKWKRAIESANDAIAVDQLAALARAELEAL